MKVIEVSRRFLPQANNHVDGIQIRVGEKVADLLVDLGVKYEYESTIPYVIHHSYTPDFVLPNGVWLECKVIGMQQIAVKSKLLNNGTIDLRFVFQAPYNTISKKSKTTYAKYCEKLGIPWSSWTNIPLDWLT